MFNNTKFLIVSLIFLSSINLLSFCKSNNKEKCLDFKEIVEFESYKKSLISDFKIDKDANKFILFNNPIASSFIVKLDKSNKELWKKSFAFESHNLFLDNKGNLIIIADYSGELDLNKDTKLNSSTKALLVLKINSKTGKLIKHFSIKTNYGINPNVSNIDESNNIYISGIYGGKSKYFEKIAYENSFILILDNELNYKWSKTFNKTEYLHISNLKIKNKNLYINLKLRKNNANRILVLNNERKELGFLEEIDLIDFDIDENGNIYTINKRSNLKKSDKNFKLIYSNKIIGFDYNLTPSVLILKNRSLFIKYSTYASYKKGILIGNYNLGLKNNWYYAIIGQSFSMSNLDIINNKLILFGTYQGNLIFSDKDYFSSKIIPFIGIFQTIK